MFVYDSSRFGQYRDRWILAADSSIAYLAQHPSSRPDLTFLGGFDGTNVSSSSSHLACFDGGNFILGGLVLRKQKYIDFGLQLVDSCEVSNSLLLSSSILQQIVQGSITNILRCRKHTSRP
jgi:mannosyl-oligosaccharide alpha-1,2-mannosidase